MTHKWRARNERIVRQTNTCLACPYSRINVIVHDNGCLSDVSDTIVHQVLKLHCELQYCPHEVPVKRFSRQCPTCGAQVAEILIAASAIEGVITPRLQKDLMP